MTQGEVRERYRAFVNDYVSPGLRARGFKGSSGHYELLSASHWALFELQRSAFSDAELATFTVNLFVVPRQRWDQTSKRPTISGLRPRPGVAWSADHGARLGMLASGDGRDDWYGLAPDTDVRLLAEIFFADVDTFGIPWMTARISSD